MSMQLYHCKSLLNTEEILSGATSLPWAPSNLKNRAVYLCGPIMFSNCSLKMTKGHVRVDSLTRIVYAKGMAPGKLYEWEYGLQRPPPRSYWEPCNVKVSLYTWLNNNDWLTDELIEWKKNVIGNESQL